MRENEQHTPGAGPARGNVVFGAGPGAGVIEPVVDPRLAGLSPQDVAQPLVILDESGIFSRELLARVWGPDGQAVLAAVKIQKDVPAVPAARGFGRSYTNLDAIAEFQREVECRCKIPSSQPGIVPLPRGLTAERLPITSLPVTYCKKTRQFFYPICPGCGEFLRDCRDEGFLARSGLPSYTNTARRVLYCPTCAGKAGAAPTVYAAAGLAQAAGAVVRVGAELYRDFARVLASSIASSAEKIQEQAGLRQFACASCAHRAACYPARPDDTRPIPAEKLLYPLAYYEFHAIPRQLYELHYDEFVQLLGGKPAEEIQATVFRRIPPEALGGGGAVADEAGAGSSPSATEVLWLKLGAFEELCAGVLQVHECCQRPHLDIQPKRVLASLGHQAPGLPARWSFRVGIQNPAAAVPVKVNDPSGEAGPVNFLSEPYFNRLYTSPFIRRQPYGHEEYANLTVRGIAGGTAELEVRGDLVSEVLSVLGLTAHDRLKLTLSAPGGPLDGFAFWAEVVEAVPGGCRIVGRPGHVQPGAAAALERLVGQTLWDCRANICRRYDVRCDLYSLGMMFLCSLLVNDEQDEPTVCQAVEDISHRLASFARSQAQCRPEETEQELRRLLAGHGGFFASEAVLYSARDRQSGAGGLPGELWFACQKLGFEMTTEIAGYSMCAGVRGIAPDQAPAAVRSVLERLKDLNLWAGGRLFARWALRRELDLAGQV